MLEAKIKDLIVDQINKEFYSAYLYLDFANFYADKGLDGFANWFEIQAQEERDHAMLMRKYLINNGVRVTFDAIAKPDVECVELDDALKAALAHEEFITRSINSIYKAAFECDDFRTMQFFDWFIKEQGEEEMNAGDLITRFSLFADGKGLYAMNQELGTRIYSAPSLVI